MIVLVMLLSLLKIKEILVLKVKVKLNKLIFFINLFKVVELFMGKKKKLMFI